MSLEELPSFPERPIRPLPKRRLREKLSPEAIRTIQYPSSAVNTVPLFYPPVHAARGLPHISSNGTQKELHEPGKGNPDGLGSRSVNSVNSDGSSASTSSAEKQLHQSSHGDIKHTTPLNRGASLGPAVSTTSSIDGYDSLENTNNKKKRKIPSAADAILRGSSFNSSGPVEILELGKGLDEGSQLAASTYSGAAGDSISGSGRGRLSRAAHMRSPLRALPDGSNTWPSKPPKTGLHQLESGRGPSGIVSNAIATAEYLPASGQENAGGLPLHHSETEKITPTAAQFTFTCSSQVTGLASWPDTSSSTTSATCPQPERVVRDENTSADAAFHENAAGEGGRRSRNNSRRQLERDLRLAARDRQQAAMDAYHDSPPRPQDIWICEFCEYEGIFGSPPKALIREYEMKDRRLRQEEADRRRLLEKAKAKSRKARKGSKSTKAIQSTNESPSQVSEDQVIAAASPMEHSHSHSTQCEEDCADNVDDCRPRDPPDILGLYGKGAHSHDGLVAKGR